MGAGTVASFGLGLIKRLVRLADAPLQIVLGMDQADAGGHGAAHALGQGAEGMGSQPLAYALNAVMQGRQVAIVQQQHEFLPTEAGDYVVAPQIGAGYAGELLQHLISGGMAVEIVDALEVIQVDQSQPQGLAAAEQGVAPLGFLDEVTAVWQVGEGIGGGQVLQLIHHAAQRLLVLL